jgi:hypothetical protein
MKYIITEHQYKLLLEQDDILRIPFAAFGNNWEVLQKFLEKRGFPPYEITDNLDLKYSEIESLGNLISVGGFLNLYKSIIEDLGNLTSVGGSLTLHTSKIESLGNLTSVGGNLYLRDTPLSREYSEDEIRSMVEVGGEVYL